MSEVLSAFRQIGGDKLDVLDDEQLTLFIGQNYPQFRQHPKFAVEYSAVKEAKDEKIINELQADITNEQAATEVPSGSKTYERLKIGLGQGIANIGKSVGATAEALQANGLYAVPIMNIPAVRRGVASMVGSARAAETEYADAGEVVGGGLMGEFGQALGAGATSMVPTVAGAWFGGMPGAMAVAGVLQFGDTYDEAFQTYLKQGMPEDMARDKALVPAVLTGVITAGLTGVSGGTEKFFSQLARGKIAMEGAKATIRHILKSAGLEGMEEFGDQFLQGFVQRATYEPDKSTAQQWKESLMAGAVGATLGAVLPVGAKGGQMVGKMFAERLGKSVPTSPTTPETAQPLQETPSAATFEFLQPPTQEGAKPVAAEPALPQAEPGQAGPLPESEIPPEALRAVPESVSVMDKLLQKAMPRRPDAPPPIVFDNETPFPDFPEHETSKKIFTDPHGAAYIPVLGKAIDPNAKHFTPVGESLNTFAAEVGRGQALASVYGGQIQGQWDSVLPVDANQEVGTVKPKHEGQSLALSDVAESLMRDPGSYEAPQDVLDLLKEVKSRGDQVRALLAKHGLGPHDVSEVETEEDEAEIQESPSDYSNYLPRVVIRRPSKQGQTPVTGGGELGKAFFEKSRVFKTEAEGIAAGYEYEPSIERRFVTFVERAYRRIAAKRLMDDPALGGLSRQTAEAQMRAELMPGEEQGSRPDIDQRIQNALRERTANPRAFFGKVFPPDTVKELNERFRESSRVWRWLSKANNFSKALSLNYDFGVWLHQGLVTFFTNPAAWGRASASAMKSMLDPNVVGEIARNNLTELREMAQMGHSFARLQDFLAGVERGQPLEHPTLGKRFGTPGKIADKAIGGTTRAFARQFTTFLDVAALELYKAQRATVKPEERMEAMRSIESILLSGRSRSIGVRPSQQHFEQAAFLASSYYRGALNLVALIAQRGIGGRMARRALGSMAFGGLAAFVGVALKLGMDWEEIEERLNPLNSEFGNWSYKLANGNVVNFGIGGVLKSFLRTIAQTMEMMAKGDWDKMRSSGKNPLTRWYRGHAGPMISATWDAITEKDYMGEKVDPGDIVMRRLMPLNLQSMVAREYERERDTTEKAITGAAETVGIQTHQESFGRTRMRELGEISQREFKTDYDRLNLSQRSKVLEKFEATPEFQNRAAMSPTLRGKITELESDAQKGMTKLLTDKAREVLEANGLDLPTFKTSFEANKRTVVLTDDERERFMEIISEDASEAIEKLSLHGSPEQKREQFGEAMTKAKARATAQMKKELPED